MTEVAERPKHTLEAYLALETESQERHEFVNGEIYAMSGGSQRHAQLIMNTSVALAGALRGKPCRPLPSAQRIRVPATGSSFYADVVVVCGKNQRAEDDQSHGGSKTVQSGGLRHHLALRRCPFLA